MIYWQKVQWTALITDYFGLTDCVNDEKFQKPPFNIVSWHKILAQGRGLHDQIFKGPRFGHLLIFQKLSRIHWGQHLNSQTCRNGLLGKVVFIDKLSPSKGKKLEVDCMILMRITPFWKYLFKLVKPNILVIFGKKCFYVCSKHEFYPFTLNKQWRIWHLSRKFDLFFNFFFEIKHSTNELRRQ